MSTLPVNGARGEVALRIGSVDLVIAAEIGRLAAVSTALECKSLSDLFNRLSAVEVAAVQTALPLLTVRGDIDTAMKSLKLKHFSACVVAFTKALSHHFEDDAGNGGAANGAAT